MKDLKEIPLEGIIEATQEMGMPLYKAKEIFTFIHAKLCSEIDAMTTLSLKEREGLKDKFYLSKLKLCQLLRKKRTIKAGFELEDGQIIETVQMEYEALRKTICVSSQAGCPIGCLFCATGKMGFKRNLSVSEILSQIYYFAEKGKINNIVFMGMGEPFLNYENVLAAARILNHPLGQNIAARKITLSTVGIISGIKKLADEPEQFRLAWSLVAAFDQKREKLIPLKNLPSIHDLIEAFKEYQEKTKRRITIEYVVLDGLNDGKDDLDELIRISKMLNSHVNLIPYNPSPGFSFKTGKIEEMSAGLEKAGVNVTIRQSMGKDIQAACGQLWASHNSF
jgi:23S rRNA (adenine2503-C2)-methyltransferase